MRALGNNLIADEDELGKVLYFSAYTRWNKEKKQKHQLYVKALIEQGVERVKGDFMPVTKEYVHNRNDIKFVTPKDYDRSLLPQRLEFKTYEEKRTDVNLAVQLFELAYLDLYDHAYIVSEDSDFVPAIETVQRRFSDKKFTAVLPPGVSPKTEKGHNKDIVKACGNVIELTAEILQASQLPDIITLKVDGSIIERPSTWKI